MLGSAVLMIEVSRFCMKSAHATISGTAIELDALFNAMPWFTPSGAGREANNRRMQVCHASTCPLENDRTTETRESTEKLCLREAPSCVLREPPCFRGCADRP